MKDGTTRTDGQELDGNRTIQSANEFCLTSPTLATFYIADQERHNGPCQTTFIAALKGCMMMKELTMDYIIKIRKNNDPGRLSLAVCRQNGEQGTQLNR